MRTLSYKITYLCLLMSICANIIGQQVDTVEVFSAKMGRNIKNGVILPAGYFVNDAARFPVLYLLNGAGGRYDTWLRETKKSLPEEASRLNMIIVCPDGQRSWYWDSPVRADMQFETYTSHELVDYIDSHYRTIANPKGRAITGFSMGGHGGLWLGIRHPDVYGACGGMCAGVDIRPYPESWNIPNLLGSYSENRLVWEDHTVINQLHLIRPNTLAIIFDIGRDDFFYENNVKLHQELIYRNIEHDFTVRPGKHTHEYCRNAIDYQLLFFYKFFQKNIQTENK